MKNNSCSNISASNVGIDECCPDFKPLFKTLQEGQTGMIESALYMILGRSSLSSDTFDFRFKNEIFEGEGEKFKVFYKNEHRYTIKTTFGNPTIV